MRNDRGIGKFPMSLQLFWSGQTLESGSEPGSSRSSEWVDWEFGGKWKIEKGLMGANDKNELTENGENWTQQQEQQNLWQ